ncbi:MAG: molybdopterin oxidoreductase family protein [Comamonadaceae bacterium]|nr:MAG: molybdopterin oxidoreductase family protein [Comamonadaceae bacterium]
MSTRQVLGACPHDCPDTCALVTTVEDGVAVKLQGNPAHLHTAGVLCTKVSRYIERCNHPERLTEPMRRVGPKGSGRFEPVGWDEALDDIAARLRAIDDPQRILPYSYAGTMGLVQGESMDRRFFHRLGASLLDRTICATAGGEALGHTLGGKVGMRVEFFSESRLILIWGSNSIASNLHFWRHAQAARRNGARLVCIDPRRTETADKCDEHVALMPGTDAALALSLMHELIVNDWLDHDYIERHTLGWERLRERALSWPPARAAAVCGVPESQIVELARAYGTTRPAAIRMNYGVQRSRGGGNASRAIACLPALTGAWRHRAGGLLLSTSSFFPVDRAALQRPDLLGARRPRTINMSRIGDALAGDPDALVDARPIEAVVVYNSNPVAVAPESSKVVAGFARDDLFTVVLEQFRTDTADYADYLLPATTQLEHFDIHYSYGHTDVLLNRPAVAPRGQARSNTWVFRELARRMGFDEACFSDDDETLCRAAFKPDAIDHAELQARGFTSLPLAEAPFAEGGFPTASGRCEFDSASLEALGLDGVPEFLPNHETGATDPRYPLAMISPPARNFLNSTFVNVASLRAIEGEPLLEINESDALRRGIVHGSIVRVFNARGEHRCRADVSRRARAGVVHGLGIWWRKFGIDGTNVNQLTSQRLTDIGRGPTFYDCAVEVEPAEAGGWTTASPAGSAVGTAVAGSIGPAVPAGEVVGR